MGSEERGYSMIETKKFDKPRKWLSRRRNLSERVLELHYLFDMIFTTICYPTFLFLETQIFSRMKIRCNQAGSCFSPKEWYYGS